MFPRDRSGRRLGSSPMAQVAQELLEELRKLADEELVALINGDLYRDHAFEVLIEERMRRKMMRWFFDHVGEERAGDLTQDVVLKLWQGALAGFDPARPFEPWLRAVCRNHLYGEFRRRQPLTLADEDLPEEADGGPTAEEQASACEEMAALDAALGQLPAEDRRVFLEHAGEGRTLKEIAGILGKSLASVFRTFRRARKRLQEYLSRGSARDETMGRGPPGRSADAGGMMRDGNAVGSVVQEMRLPS